MVKFVQLNVWWMLGGMGIVSEQGTLSSTKVQPYNHSTHFDP
jgi:hypothetical protein